MANQKSKQHVNIMDEEVPRIENWPVIKPTPVKLLSLKERGTTRTKEFVNRL